MSLWRQTHISLARYLLGHHSFEGDLWNKNFLSPPNCEAGTSRSPALWSRCIVLWLFMLAFTEPGNVIFWTETPMMTQTAALKSPKSNVYWMFLQGCNSPGLTNVSSDIAENVTSYHFAVGCDGTGGPAWLPLTNLSFFFERSSITRGKCRNVHSKYTIAEN